MFSAGGPSDDLLRAWLAGLPAYLWSGWGAIASLLLLLAAWEAVQRAYGPLILPDPATTFATLVGLIDAGTASGRNSPSPRAAR
jgi:NitT/TauT family transport system permease protein